MKGIQKPNDKLIIYDDYALTEDGLENAINALATYGTTVQRSRWLTNPTNWVVRQPSELYETYISPRASGDLFWVSTNTPGQQQSTDQRSPTNTSLNQQSSTEDNE